MRRSGEEEKRRRDEEEMRRRGKVKQAWRRTHVDGVRLAKTGLSSS